MSVNKLLAMQLFVRVVETGGLTRAADSLRLPKASATALLQKLEAELGVRLLNRTTRRMSVTAEGRLRVDAPTLMARSVIVPALPSFFARYPEIELELGSSERRADLVEEG